MRHKSHFSGAVFPGWFSAVAFFIICGLFLFYSRGTLAKPVDAKHAEKAIKTWLKREAKPLNAKLGSEIKSTEVFNGTDGNPAYYVIHLNPWGFIIVCADDLAEPIVGFVAGGTHYDPSPTNPLGALVSRDLPGRIDIARKVQAQRDAHVQRANLTPDEALQEDNAVKATYKWNALVGDDVNDPNSQNDPNCADPNSNDPNCYGYGSAGPPPSPVSSVSDLRVAPLVTSTWGQNYVCCTCSPCDSSCGSYCYNFFTPDCTSVQYPYSGNAPCGCAATAMVQLMRYHQWPVAGIGVHTFNVTATCACGNPPVDTPYPTTANTHGDGSGGPYIWTDMPPNPACSGPSAITYNQRAEIGNLCSDAGAAVHMQYSLQDSAAYMHDVRSALVNTFMYSNAVMGGDEQNNIGSGLTAMINPNLDARLPVLLGIWGSSGGHAIVADGYGYNSGTLYHHLNMGWSGLDDTWYYLPNINASPDSFNTVDACIYNVYTRGSGEIISGRITHSSSGLPFVGAIVTASGPNGSSFTATSDPNGIYAFVHVQSATTYTVSVPGQSTTPASRSVTTGTSGNTSGDQGGNDFTVSP